MKNSTGCNGCGYEGKAVYAPVQSDELDLLVVLGYPQNVDCKMNTACNKELGPLKHMVLAETPDLDVGYQFAMGCSPLGKGKKRNVKPKKEVIVRCRPRLLAYVEATKPKVILLSGIEACWSLGIPGIMKNLRGTVHSVKIGQHEAMAVVAYGIYEIGKQPGLHGVLRNDLLKAAGLCQEEPEDPGLSLETPISYEDVITGINRMQESIDRSFNDTGKRHLLAVTIKTTSLEPYRSDGRVITISLSVAKNHGLAFMLEHRESPYTREQHDAILEKVQKLLDPKKVVTCTADAKVVYKWLVYRYGLAINFFDFDILLAEHILEGDKKGEYNLKSLTRDYFPEFTGYRDEMKKMLDAKSKELRLEYKKAVGTVLGGLEDWWVLLSDKERESYLGDWVEKGYLPASIVDALSIVKTVKKGKELIVPKGYKVELAKALQKVPTCDLGVEMPIQRKVTYEDVPAWTMLEYAAMDALVTRELFIAQYKRMSRKTANIHSIGVRDSKSLRDAFREHTMRLSGPLAEMEHYGMRFDVERAIQYIAQIEYALTEHREVMFSEVGRKFSLSSSSPDLRGILFREMSYKSLKETDTGLFCTDAEVVKALYEKHGTHFLKSLLMYCKLETALKTLLRWMKFSQYDGRIRMSLDQNGTATYRLSSSKPNLQNVKHYVEEAQLNLKSLFLPDDDNYEFYDLDISNAEMRVLSAYSRDEILIKAFENDMDIHSITAAGMSSYDYESIILHKEDKHSEQYVMRQVGKKVNFATVYGQGAMSLSEDLTKLFGSQVTKKDAQIYLDQFFATYPGISEYVTSTKEFVSRYGFAYTYEGRIRSFPLAKHDRHHLFTGYRQAVNFRIQSSAADIINANLVDLADCIKPIGGRVVLTVHDSILFQLPKGTTGVRAILDEVFLERTRERFPWLPVKWAYDVAKGPNYGECAEPLM